jgi:tetratricopeptide (TPR) repeat protein
MSNSIRNIILFGCCMLCSLAAYTQNKAIDSLQKVLTIEKEDSNKVNTILKLNDEYYLINDENNALAEAKDALTLAAKIKFQRGMADAYRYIGISLLDENHLTEASENASKALNIYQQTANKRGIAKSYKLIARIYELQGDYPDNLKNLYNALKLFEEIGDKKQIGSMLFKLGVSSEDMGNDSEALENFLAALKIGKEIDDKALLCSSYFGIVDIKVAQGNLQDALKFDSLALNLSEESANKINIASTYFQFGKIYLRLGNLCRYKDKVAANDYYSKSKACSFASLSQVQALNNSSINSYLFALIGEANTWLNKLAEAKKFLQLSLKCAKESGLKGNFEDVYYTLAKFDSVEGNMGKAYEDYKLYIVYHDSLNNDETAKKSLQLKMQFESDKKEALEKAEREKEQAAEERKENLEYLAIVSIIILVLAFLFIATRTHVPLKWIDITGFVGVLLFFQFIETLLHPTITKYTHGSPLLFMGINILLASSIKPLHHTIEKRLIKISHHSTEKRRLKKIRLEEEMRRKAEEQRIADEERRQDDGLESPI